MEIVGKNAKQIGMSYCMEITLSENVDYIWEESYMEATGQGNFTVLFSSGAPTVKDVSFCNNKATTKLCSEFAIRMDGQSFYNQFKKCLVIADNNYMKKKNQIAQNQEAKKTQEENKEMKLKELNKIINNFE